MDIHTWERIINETGVKKIDCSYIGGFEPLIMKKNHGSGVLSVLYLFVVKILVVIFSSNFKFLRKKKSKNWSGYLIGLYTKL